MRNPYYRMDSTTADKELKKVIHDGIQPTHIMLDQQIRILEDLNCKFYFFSRQKMQWRVWNAYIKKFNDTFNRNLIISKNRYWICGGEKENCAQYLVHEKNRKIPFKQYHHV